MREIVTLQFGEQANYVATHFWNTQEAYFVYSDHEESLVDPNISFRAGIGADGSETFTPRTVIYDMRANFGSLRQINELYQPVASPEAPAPWSHGVVTQQQPQIPSNEYQVNLAQGLETPQLTTETVRYWSDFNRVFYHPRSQHKVYEADLSDGNEAFDEYEHGWDLYAKLNGPGDSSELYDNDMRPVIEECDQLQGIQVISSIDDGWGGFATNYIEDMYDAFGHRNIFVWALSKPQPENTTQRRLSNRGHGRSIATMHECVELLSPMAVYAPRTPYSININPASLWHTSALQATVLECATLPCRLRDQSAVGRFRDMNFISQALNHGRNTPIVEARLGLCALSHNETPQRGSNANANGSSGSFNQLNMLPYRHSAPDRTFPKLSDMCVNRGLSDMQLPFGSPERTRRTYPVSLLYPLPTSFPEIFVTGQHNPQSIPIATLLSVSMVATPWMEELALAFRNGANEDDLINRERLKEIGDKYTDGRTNGYDWDSSDDE